MTDEPNPDNEPELVALIRSIDVAAPRHLHERVEAMVAERERRPSGAGVAISGLRLRLGAAATALVAAGAALAIALSGPGSAGVSLAAASAVTLRAPTMAAPRESQTDHGTLTASVEGVRFPYWEGRFHWRSTGSRIDTLDGRSVRTVFYADRAGHTVGYAILSGKAPRVAGAGRVQWRAGTAYSLGKAGGTQVVTWKRDGHLCVIAARGVSGSKLLALASWAEPASAA